MQFSRWQPFFERTMAYHLFKRHHTHFNRIFWSHSAARTHAYAATRQSNRSDHAETVFRYARNNRRLNFNLDEWADHYEDFDRWTRYAAVLAIAGYLDAFLAQVAGAALESCPALLIGGSREIDGVSLLKMNGSYSFYDNVKPIIRGDWGARAAAYKRLFKDCPFESDVPALDRMRRLRNDAGHAFGRNISMLQMIESAKIGRLPRMSDKKLCSLLKVVERVANLVEKQIGCEYVGSYEVIRIYHSSHKKEKNCVGRRQFAARLSERLNEAIGSPCGIVYGEQLIAEYERA